MCILRVTSFLCLFSVSIAEDGAPCSVESEVKPTEECERVYKCTPYDGKWIWVGFSCPAGSKPNPTATECQEGKCLPGAVTPAPETTSTAKPLEFDCEANMPRENDVGFAADPNDCSKYYYCIRNGDRSWSFSHADCHPEHHFYPTVRQCLYALCPKDVLPAVIPPPGGRFYCQNFVPHSYIGFVADPFDCTWYYHCEYGHHNQRWKINHYECPEGYHYNVIDAGCVRGPCP